MLFVLSMIPLTCVVRKTKAGYDLGDGSGIVNHLFFMNDLKLYGKNENQVDSLVQAVRIFTEDIQMMFEISKCATLIMKRGKAVKCEGILIPVPKIKALNNEEECESNINILESSRQMT